MKRFLMCISSLLFLSLPFQTIAKQPDALEEGLETLLFLDIPVSIAAKTVQKIADAPAIVSVITAAQIKAMGAKTLTDVMNTLPGIYFALPSLLAQENYLRGISSIGGSKIKLLINGIPINEGIKNSWSALMSYGAAILDMVEKIEIIRGPGSVIYGDHAFQGVINIITKSKSGNEFNISGGNNNLKKAFVKYEGDLKDFNINVMSTFRDFNFPEAELITRDVGVLQTFQGKLNQFQSKNLFLTLSYKGFILENLYMKENQKQPVTLSFVRSSDVLENQDTIIEYTCLKKTFDLDNLVLSSKLLFRKAQEDFHRLTFTLPGTPTSAWTQGIFGTTNYGTDTWFGQIEGIYSGLKDNNFIFGIEYMHEKHGDINITANTSGPDTFTDLLLGPDKLRKLSSIYIGDNYIGIEKLTINLGIRYDYYNDLKSSSTNPRMAMIYKLTDTLNLKLLYGTAFRPPNIGSETATVPDHPQMAYNPNLKSETLKTYEVALDYAFLNKANLILNYYNNQIDDLIQLVQSNEPSKVWYQNIGKQKSWGLEGEIKYCFDEKKINYLFSNIAWLGDSTNVTTHSEMPYMPEILFNVGINYYFTERMSALVKGFYRSKLEPEAGDWRGAIDSFWTFDTNINYRISSCDIYLNIQNIFDQEWKDPMLFSSQADLTSCPGRTFEVGCRYNF